MDSLRILGGVDASGNGISLGIEGGLQGSADMSSPYLDATGLTIVPGFIDIQINGAYGFDFTQDPSSIWSVGERLPETGVTSFCPTIITSPTGTIERAQEAMASRPDGYRGAEPIGLHIEGPHLSHAKRGTHPANLLRPPADASFTTEHIAIVTVAPELDGALELIERLAKEVVVSIGHSTATATQAEAAIEAGATLGTHILNAMPAITAREPGIAGVLLSDARTGFGVISDGIHHHPATLRLLWAAAPDRFIVITDAMAAAGMPDGHYEIGAVEVDLTNGAVHNSDGVLAGAASLMDRNLQVLLETTGAPLVDAIDAVTFNPSEAVRRWDLGRIRRGARGDLTLLDGHRIAATIIGGDVVHLSDPTRLKDAPNAPA